jgi:malonyl-ACP decarboxylase
MKSNKRRDENPTAAEDIMLKRVVVTGMGITSAIGLNIPDFSRSLWEGRSGIGFLSSLSASPGTVKIGAEIRDFSFAAALGQAPSSAESILQKAGRCAQRSPFTIQASVLAALEAWESAGLSSADIPPHRLGIIIAGTNLNQRGQYEGHQKFQQAPEYLNPRYALHFLDTDHAGVLSEILGIQGEGFSVGGASASGNVGIINGFRLVQPGRVEACLVVGALMDLSLLELQGFYNLGALGGRRFNREPDKACRPFDKDHEGFIYGQACGSLILESLESARRRGVPILAEVLGGSLVLDGNHLSNPGEDGEVRAMTLALDQAKVAPREIDYLNAHGTSSPLGDETEVRAVRRVFDDHLSHLWINATKGLTGHCLCSAGVIECIATIIQMQQGFMHPNANLDNPIDPECRWVGRTAVRAGIEISMSNSFGFGGINSSIILKKGV